MRARAPGGRRDQTGAGNVSVDRVPRELTQPEAPGEATVEPALGPRVAGQGMGRPGSRPGGSRRRLLPQRGRRGVNLRRPAVGHPKSGNVWPEAERKLWLQLLEGSFKLIYKDKQDEAAN
jgi:hypothetical protein